MRKDKLEKYEYVDNELLVFSFIFLCAKSGGHIKNTKHQKR